MPKRSTDIIQRFSHCNDPNEIYNWSGNKSFTRDPLQGKR